MEVSGKNVGKPSSPSLFPFPSPQSFLDISPNLSSSPAAALAALAAARPPRRKVDYQPNVTGGAAGRLLRGAADGEVREFEEIVYGRQGEEGERGGKAERGEGRWEGGRSRQGGVGGGGGAQ